MACPINRTTILNGIKNKIVELSGLQRDGDRLLNVTEDVLENVNNLFEEEVILEDGTISVSDELVDYYEQSLLAEEANVPNTAYLQSDRSEDLPRASKRTLEAINDFLQRAGVKVKEVYDIVINGKKLTANGAALPLQSLVLYTQGNEDITLAEEAFHIGVELLSQKEPGLFNQMMAEITSYPLYKKVFAEYKDSPTYQKDGKPDIYKIKKEAVGKLLAQRLQDKKTHSWWTKLKNFLKGFFTGFMTEFDVFTKAVDTILQQDLGTVRDTLLKSEPYLTSQGLSEEQVQEVIYLAYSNITDDELRIAIANMLEGYAFLQLPKNAQTAFELLKNKGKDIDVSSDGKTVTVDSKPVNNTFLSWAEGALKTKVSKISKEYAKIMGDIEGNATALSHLQAADVLNRFIDSNGDLVQTPDAAPRSALFDDSNYGVIEDEVRNILDSFPEGTKFLRNINIYNEAKDLGGKVDLIAMTPDGKANIVMFQETNFKEGERMNPAERQALTAVVDAIRLTLKTDYKIHEFGLSRVIPFNKMYKKGVVTIQVGTKRVENKDLDYLYPIPSQYETTGNLKLDKALQKLGALYSKYHRSSDKKEQLELNDMLSGLMRGARALQIKNNQSTLQNQANRVAAKVKELIEEYNTDWAKLDPKKAYKEDIQKFSQELLIISQIASTLEELDAIVGEVTQPAYKRGDTLKKLSPKLSDVIWNFTNKFSAEKNGIQNLLSAEVIQNSFNRTFRGISQSNIAAVELLGKLVEGVKRKSELIRNEYIQKIIPIQKEFKKWLKDNNISPKNQLDLITQKDSKGRYIHKLVEKYDISFYEGVTKARETGDIEWVNKNIDLEKYNKDFQEYKKNKLEVIEDSVMTTYEFIDDEAKIQEIIDERVANEIDIFDLSKGVSENNTRLKNYPLQQYSPEYRELLKPSNKPALDLYNLIQEQNQQAFELGVLTEFEARTFIPFKRLNGVGDRLIYGGKRRLITDFGRSFTITEEEAEFVNTDEMTGELKENIPFYMLYDISSKRIDPDTGETYRDYSDVSTDIFEILDIYNFQNTKYELYSGIEAELRNVSNITRTKQALQTTTFGEASKGEGTVDNTLNADYYDTLLELTLYGRKNTGASYDKNLGTISNKFAKSINKLLGSGVLDENAKDRKVSLANTMDSVKKWFILKTLALKLPTAAASFVGTTLTGSIEAGTFFSKREWWANWLKVTGGKIGEKFTKGDDVRLGLLNYFMILNSDENNRQTAEQLTLNTIKKINIPKLFMGPLNYADRPALYANGLSYLSNTMIVDGKFVNIREYVNKQSNWAELPTQEEREAKKREDQEAIKKYKETQALDKIAHFDKDGKLVIPGMERTSDEVANLRARIMNLGTNVVGMTDEMRGGQGNVLFRMFMTFKSWLPRQLSRRFDKLRYTPGTDTYDWGRYQVFGNFLHQVLKTKGATIVDLLSNSDKGIEMLKEEYEKQRQAYYLRTGKELDDNFTETQFIDLYQSQVKNTFIEFSYILALYGLFLGIGAMAPDDDDDLGSKNFFKYSLKVMDKGLDEMLFYINPKEALNIANGGILPPLGVVKDIMKASDHLSKEVWGSITDNQELSDKAQPTKYVLKTLPLGGAVILPLLAMSQADLAKELGYKETDPMDHLQ